MTVEVCSFSVESCLVAQANGAHRIELCGGAAEGGTTPSYGLLSLARDNLRISLYAMIRPRGGDFLYNESETELMRRDIAVAKELGADGLVLGCLRSDGTVDEVLTTELIALAAPLPVTFHRAFDVTRDPLEALEAVIRCGAARILTSGQQPAAEAGIPLLSELVHRAAGRIEIMAGAGVTPANAARLAATGIQSLHLTGKQLVKSRMNYRRPEISMASVALAEDELLATNGPLIREVVSVATQARPQFLNRT